LALLEPGVSPAQTKLLAHLRRHARRTLLTLGDGGATLYRRAEGETHVGVYATQALDPSGAGDSFAAAFLWQLARGLSEEDALRLAAAIASIVVEGRGTAAMHRLGEARGRAADIALSGSGPSLPLPCANRCDKVRHDRGD
jgi:sugar/nucleoside kinase (ribokinase family)